MTMNEPILTVLIFIVLFGICLMGFLPLADTFWYDHVIGKRDEYRAKAMLMPIGDVINTVASPPPKKHFLGGWFINPQWEEYQEICDYAREQGVYR
jgi:uncharacterized SAM-binding protein YcdF (DUF218 family)